MYKFLLFVFFLCSIKLIGQTIQDNSTVVLKDIRDDTLKNTGNSYVFRIIPSRKNNIFGIAFGLIGSETFCYHPTTRKSHGINIQIIGQGLFISINRIINRRAFSYKNNLATDTSWMVQNRNNVTFKAIHNGLLVSGLGTMTELSNGIVISGLCSMGYKMNGLAINLLSGIYTQVNGLVLGINNEAFIVNGFQIGILNRTTKLKGFQLGLWNVNEKRKLPILNWSFK